MEPRVIGPFEILSELGRGGFATVYRARDSRDGRDVALKVLRSGEGDVGIGGTPQGVSPVSPSDEIRRFRREIEAARALDHPGIVRILDASPEGAEPAWVAMELVEGESLAARIASEPLPWRQAVEIARDVADALAAAHAKGILHRDVKPANILLDREGRPRLVDFGLVKLTATGSKLTRTGQALGTPVYMSPEQARGEVADLTPATDVWSLGCVLHEMLVARPPFEGETDAALVASVLTAEPPRLRALRGDVPEPVERLVRIALGKRAPDRPRDGAELREELDRILRGEALRARLPGSRRRRAAVAVGLVALLGSAAAWAILLGGSAAPSPPPAPVADSPDPWERSLRAARVRRATSPSMAAELLGAVARERPADRALARERADCLREAGSWKDAEAAYTAILAADPSDAAAQCGRGLARWMGREAGEETLGDPREDLAGAARAAGGAGGALARAILAFEGGQWTLGEREIEAAGDSWEARAVAGLLRHHAGQRGPEEQERAVRDFTAALATGPPIAWIAFERGHARDMLGDVAGAIEDYGKAVQIDPRHAKAWYNRGCGRQDRGDLAGAIDDYSRALGVDPGYTSAWSNRGNARRALGDLPGAIEDFGKALAINPKLAPAWNNRGAARRAQGDLGGAIEDYGKALENSPAFTEAWYNRGFARAAQGDLDGAIEDYGRALALDPREPDAWTNRGNARRARGDLAGAIADYEKALDVAPRGWRLRAGVERNLTAARAALAASGGR